MRLRHIPIAAGAAIVIVLIFCGIEREFGRDEARQPALATPSPWSVVCDNEGHYTFTQEDGRVWSLQEWGTYDAAMRYCVTIKNLRESYMHGNTTDEERRRYKEIAARKWEACPP